MAQVERIRSFIAIDIGTEVRTALRTVTSELARTGADVRWVRAEGMHATLKFLGGVEATRLQAVREAVAEAVRDHCTMTLSVRGLGAFPSMRRPRVLWAGLLCEGLAEVASDIDTALLPLGFAAEKRPFHPHITLARVRSPRGWQALSAAVERHKDDEFGRIEVSAATIYRSTLRPDGAVYDALWTIPVAQHR